MNRNDPSREVASSASAFVLFVVSFGLHIGLHRPNALAVFSGVHPSQWELGTLIVSILVPLWIALRLLHLDARSALNAVPPNWGRLAIAVPAGFALAFAFNLVWPRLVAPSPQYIQRAQEFLKYQSTSELVGVIVLVVFGAPIVDEFLFRGFLLRAWPGRYGAPVAVVLTALCTAAFHTWEPFKLGHAFAMGIISPWPCCGRAACSPASSCTWRSTPWACSPASKACLVLLTCWLLWLWPWPKPCRGNRK